MYTEPGVPPPRVRPPLTQRLTRRQWILLDCLVAVVTVVIMAGSVLASDHSEPAPRSVAMLALSLLLAAAGGVPVALRRLRPLLALEALFALSVLLSVIQAQDGLIVAVPATYVLYTVAATSPRRTAAIALGCALVTVVAETFRVWATDSGRLGSAPLAGALPDHLLGVRLRGPAAPGCTPTACSSRRPAGRWPRNGCVSRGNCTTWWRTA